ncbi:prolyl oligopeptidase family serine peptidase [Roseateles sp. BYS180W]|uniref:Prolyl oligopeptidase family serine peptidase n=1 Tax=Roseateles rivi TaxID=3299028 RepID=A0ABW7FWU1_9BURK
MSHRHTPDLPKILLASALCAWLASAQAQNQPSAESSAASAQAAASAPQALSFADFALWRTIQGTQISADGQWAAYALHHPDEDGELVLRHLGSDKQWRVPRGALPQFSPDSRYVAFTVQVPRAELERAKREKKKGDDLPKPGAGWLDLASGHTEQQAGVKRWAWPEEGPALLALLLEAPRKDSKDGKATAAPTPAGIDDDASADLSPEADQEAPPPQALPGMPGSGEEGASATPSRKVAGTELLVLDLREGAAANTRHNFQDVDAFIWAKQGQRLALSRSLPDKAPASARAAEGVYLWHSATASTQTLASGAGRYRQLRFDDAGRQLAFVSNRAHVAQQPHTPEPREAERTDAPAPTPFELLLWREGQTLAEVIASAGRLGLPPKHGPSEHANLDFSADGARLFFGTAVLRPPLPKGAPEPLKVDLWHWKDPELQSAQKVNAERERQRSLRAVAHISAQGVRLVQLGTEAMPHVQTNDNPRWALGLSDVPYRMQRSWEGFFSDVYVVDMESGESRLLARKLRQAPRLSPAGRYIAGFDAQNRRWLAWESQSGKEIDLSSKLSQSQKLRFEQEEHDTPDLAPPYGLAGWTADDARLVVYDRYDLWALSPQGEAAVNLSRGEGRRHKLELRVLPLEPKGWMDRPLPEQLMLSAVHDTERDSGFYRLDLKSGTAPQRLIYGPQAMMGMIKARSAERVLFTRQSFTEFPDLWSADLWLSQAPQRISEANPQQARFRWGTQELITYKTAKGKTMRALLAKPADFDPKKRYPLMVNFYEKFSGNRYQYVVPAASQNINPSRYVSNGYLVLRPDVDFTIGQPGQSALDSVVPAVRQLIAQGIVDPKRVGVQGHSWGAYQINYLITRTDLFAAASAGASMANMISGYGGIRWGTGLSRAFQYEMGQSRMATTPWQNPQAYVNNSPIFQVHKVKTPYITVHSDEDDAVPYGQAIEFFTALRRLGKEAYWFNYNGEKHALRDRDGVRHYTVHMTEFFDHYLLGAPRPAWMDTPVPYLERGQRNVIPLFKPSTPR